MPLNQLNLDGWQKYDHIDHYRSPLKNVKNPNRISYFKGFGCRELNFNPVNPKMEVWKCLEDDLPFQLGDFKVLAGNFPGCEFMTPSAFEANQIHVSVQCHRSPELTKDEVGSSQCLTMSWNMSINLTTVDRQIKREPVCWQLHLKPKTRGINKRHGHWAWYPSTKTKIYQTSNGAWTSYLLKVNRHRYHLQQSVR